MAKTILKYVGEFRELGYDDRPHATSIHESRGKRPTTNKAQVVAYLRGATTFISSPGSDDDVFDSTKRAGSASVMTDGTFVWQKTLAYYVENYDVALSPDFEQHMARNDWKPPAVDKLKLELPSV
jgi:hypothetical protein